MITKRQGIIVWLRHNKYGKRLRKYGHLIYTSKNQKYSLLYVDQDEVDDAVNQLRRLNFVKKVDVSYKPHIDMVFQKKVPEKDNELELRSF